MALRKQHFDDDHVDNVKQQQIEKNNTSNVRKRYRLTFDLTPELEERIKIAALKNHVSISDYLGNILEEVVPQESTLKQQRRPIHSDALEKLNRTREKIMERREGKLFEGLTEMIREMREERIQHLMEIHDNQE